MESHDAKMLRKQLKRMGAMAVHKESGEVFGRQNSPLRIAQPVNSLALRSPKVQARPVSRKRGSATQVLIHESASPAQRAELTKANLAFANAPDRAAKISAVKSVLKELARLAGIKAHMLEVPALSYVLAAADDCLEGRNPHLWRAVSGITPPSNREMHAPQRLAVSCILQCAAVAQKTLAHAEGAQASFRVAMLKVIADLEGRLNGVPLDHFLGEGKDDNDKKSSDTNARTARREALVKRFQKYRSKLKEGSCSISEDYRVALKGIETTPTAELLKHAEHYENALVASKVHLINGRVGPDDKLDPKG